MKLKVFIIAPILIMPLFLTLIFPLKNIKASNERVTWWEIQSIDTMKFSRDLAREKLNDLSFNETIDRQMQNISLSGATHVAIGTPYDEEFLPFLKRWVKAARNYRLNIWFRGNLSGWEGWFGYPKITREEHIQKTRAFILNNQDLFQDGDIFTSCSECENGGPGDPRNSGDIIGHRRFLINEYQLVKQAFSQIKKDVIANYYSMNGDVAKLIMDKETTKALDGVVTLDHYVANPEQLLTDIREIKEKSAGKIVLGEFGVPIPDIHGNLSQAAQSDWIDQAFSQISQEQDVIGVNYWVGFGGSSKLWESNGIPRTAVSAVKKYFKPNNLKGIIRNEIREPIKGAAVSIGPKSVRSDSRGSFSIPYIYEYKTIRVSANGYKQLEINDFKETDTINITLIKDKDDLVFNIRKYFFKLVNLNKYYIRKFKEKLK